MPALTIRLDPETARQARALRARGLVVSDVVRAAIRDAYARSEAEPTESRVAVLDRIVASYPQEEVSRRFDAADARQAREAIHKRLARKRP